MTRVYIKNEEDRLSIATLLIKNGYTARAGKTRRTGAKVYDYFVEFWKDDNKGDGTDDA